MPRRRCVGCGRIAPKSDLVRIALVRDGRMRAVIDPAGTLPGRGAYLCRIGDGEPNADCLRRAERSRGIARTLRSAVTLERELVESTKRMAQSAAGRRAGPLAISKP
jgi:predicted RNA-binding protein YlxR (DUF448 family)